MNPKPTELQNQAAALTVAATLTRAAALSGAPNIAPRWNAFDGLLDGHFHSEDTSAQEALQAWLPLLGTFRISSYDYTASSGPRHVTSVYATVDEVSVHLAASVPAVTAVGARELVAA